MFAPTEIGTEILDYIYFVSLTFEAKSCPPVNTQQIQQLQWRKVLKLDYNYGNTSRFKMRAEAPSQTVLNNWQLHSSFSSVYQSVKLKAFYTMTAVSLEMTMEMCFVTLS